jgi:hypothetical protein
MVQWDRAGAFDPAASLLEEARHLRRRALQEGHWTDIAREALDWTEAMLVEQSEREHQPA